MQAHKDNILTVTNIYGHTCQKNRLFANSITSYVTAITTTTTATTTTATVAASVDNTETQTYNKLKTKIKFKACSVANPSMREKLFCEHVLKMDANIPYCQRNWPFKRRETPDDAGFTCLRLFF